MPRLNPVPYMRFPLRWEAGGPALSDRPDHVREQIEQVLFTDPGERVFRPEFGAGVRRWVFEPNAPTLVEVARKRLMASLAEALEGEVDPKSITVEVTPEEEKLIVDVTYTLATIGMTESQRFVASAGGGGNG